MEDPQDIVCLPAPTEAAPQAAVVPTLKQIQDIVARSKDGTLTVQECFIAAGIDLVAVYREIYRIATSAMIIKKSKYGDEPDEETPNEKSRLIAITLLLETAEHIRTSKHGQNVNVGVIVEYGHRNRVEESPVSPVRF